MNLAAGFVYSMKGETNNTIIHLVPSFRTRIPLVPTRYPQGRGNKTVYGPPFSVCLGFPATSNKLNTRGKIAYTNTLVESFFRGDIKKEDFFGSAEFLVPMLNGGCKSPLLAYTNAHRILLIQENPSSKVRTLCLSRI